MDNFSESETYISDTLDSWVIAKCEKWKEQLEALPDINQEVEELDRDKTEVLKAENN